MAARSLRKRFNQRSNSINLQHNQMASSSPPWRLTYRKASFLISAVIFVCVLLLLSISWNMRSAFGSDHRLDLVYSAEVVRVFPHDPNAFTQGLLYAGNDTFFESTGLNGRSSVRKVALGTGKVEAIHEMQHSFFGEGLTLLGEKLFQVTWLQNTGFIYDRNNLSQIGTFVNQMNDGWGLATDGKVIFGSDGSSTLYQLDPRTFKVILKQTVKFKGHEVHNLNELEYVNGEVWANVWQTDCIARISVTDGAVLGWLFLPYLRESLVASGARGIDVLNGIAWDREKNRIFVTGKLWPKLYEIKLHQWTPFNGDIGSLCLTRPHHF
ncbi:glutaminyl-peptide cyclotransferase-like [Dorcoceras hygrometricum]|uniref:Glutaminyl-peptide cyclotransferase-like n=1 Tax=Dorcoceras hygrometricum TaxID=472368 RepID=A0A2Z7C8Y9_9LAMI|nr:glutaminyl-peptide cyclotransferase-like [Dorcoceras hygrometricum]